MINFKNSIFRIIYYFFWRFFGIICKPYPRISLSGKLKNVKLGKYSRLFPGVKLSNTIIGDYTYIGNESWISNCQIGNYCSISTGVKIGMGMHPSKKFSSSPIFYSNRNPFPKGVNNIKFDFIQNENTCIGNDVWIGINAIILDGISIGDGAIIAANSVVTKDVLPYTIVGGVPSKKIGERKLAENFYSKKNWYNLNYNEI